MDVIDERLRRRLEVLKREFKLGQQNLADLKANEAELTETLLRISGAIQVLEEELSEPDSESSPNGDRPPIEEIAEHA